MRGAVGHVLAMGMPVVIPQTFFGAGANGHPEAPDWRPLGACPYRIGNAPNARHRSLSAACLGS